MKCDVCGVDLQEKLATTEQPYEYTISGLRNVLLTGIRVRQCKICDVTSPIIPRIEELHRLIAKGLVIKPRRLSGAEIRFLRKNAGFPARDFAALLGVTPEHLSRIENGHTEAFGPAADRLARLLGVEGQSAREALAKMAEAAKKHQARRMPPPRFRLAPTGWKVAA